MTSGFDVGLAAKGLAARLADIDAVRARNASFVYQPGRDRAGGDDGGGTDEHAARDLVVRVLARVGDPINDRILDRLAHGDASTAELAAVAGLPVAAVWERVNDLVQVGLVARSLEHDRAGLTATGAAFADLVAELASRTAEAVTP